MLLKLLLIIYLVYALILSIVATTPLHATSSHLHHHVCKPPYSRLYVYTNPVIEECVLLMHEGKVVNASGATVK
jgi:hypothetical protein